MDNVPSKSISKSILVVTPLFLIVLAVLHSSSQLSYLFILKFINNVAGSADITFLPTTQPEVTHQAFNKESLMKQFGLYQQPLNTVQSMSIPLINLKQQQKWMQNKSIIKGASPRWIIPTKIENVDSLLLIVNITRQTQIGMINPSVLPQLDGKEIAIQDTLLTKLGYSIGDVASITMQPKNMLNGMKLFQKFRSEGSDQQYVPQGLNDLQYQSLSSMIYKALSPYLKDTFTEQQYKILFKQLYESSVDVEYTVKKGFYPEGIYPSALSNVIIMEYEGFSNLISGWIVKTILSLNKMKTIDIVQKIPEQYRPFWPQSQFQAKSSSILAQQQLKTVFQQWALMSVCRLQSRQQIYNPYQGEMYNQFAAVLESVPGDYQVIAIYPFFKQSLAIKFFFDSVIQIFEFVTCIIYFYTITLIMKQVYEEKQVEVGIWRTLGAGGLPRKKQVPLEIQMDNKRIISRGSRIKYNSQFEQQISWKQKFGFISNLAFKVGFINYWLATTVFSILLYALLKLVSYHFICQKLGFSTIMQPLYNLPILFLIIFCFLQIVIYVHIQRIYTNPLSETIKPVKRTFDVVKVRVIHVATFGVSLEVLLIAVMLVYYGVVSYYWIPFAVLDGQQDLQVLLFNTIFLFMIFGSIILLGILQSRIEVAIFNIIFRFSAQMRCMKLAILKNIKAKQYKNIKVAIIVSIIFAFVLFFTAGIKIQMQIIQSFIQRALGSNLVFENYQKNTFKTQPINQYLQSREGIQYSWLSRSLSRDNVSIVLLSHISGKRLTPQFQTLSPSYLNSTFYQYYYPENYMPDYSKYWKLPNSIHDGFNSIYDGDYGAESVGKFNPDDSIGQVDPYKIYGNHDNSTYYPSGRELDMMGTVMAPEEQVINLVVSSGLRKDLGVRIGDNYKMIVENRLLNKSYFLRAKITHSFKAGPAFDMLGNKAFISTQQAAYIYRILGVDESLVNQNEKLLIKGSQKDLKGVGSTIITMSPDHTQMFQIEFVSKSFYLLQKYLNAYVVLITCIMSALVTIFIFLYTLSKCREEAEMYKMLRAIGLSAKNIRIMVFLQIIIRLIVAMIDGILLGIIFSIGFSMQIEEFLMIKTPIIDITIVSVIGVVLIGIFSITIIRATKYIAERTVAETNKI